MLTGRCRHFESRGSQGVRRRATCNLEVWLLPRSNLLHASTDNKRAGEARRKILRNLPIDKFSERGLLLFYVGLVKTFELAYGNGIGSWQVRTRLIARRTKKADWFRPGSVVLSTHADAAKCDVPQT
eukprot:364818-Chlamydomonas_euryale.AAC.29